MMYTKETIQNFDAEAYAVYVEGLRVAEAVSPKTTTVSTLASELGVRHAGGYLVRGALGNPDTYETQEIFYVEPDIIKSKLAASHLMLPVGPHEGPGGQHGAARWLKHDVTVRPWLNGTTRLNATPIAPHWSDEGNILRTFSLDSSKLTATTILDVHRSGAVSLGHHDYYHLRDGDYEGFTINGKSIDTLLDAPGATDEVMSGKAHLWSDFDGKADVRFPDGTRLGITAQAKLRGIPINEQLGMLLWRRPNAPYICLEPTIGVQKDGEGNLRTEALDLGGPDSRRGAALLYFTVGTELLSRDA